MSDVGIPQHAVRRRTAWMIAAATLIFCAGIALANEAWFTHVSPVDFQVYRLAAQAAFAGQNLYTADVSGLNLPSAGLPFTYTPFAAFVLWPTTLFDATTAYLLWTTLNLAALAFVIYRFVPLRQPHRVVATFAILVVARFSVIGEHHLYFGQINLILMALCIGDIFRSPQSRFGRLVPPGVLIGVAAAIKLTPIVFLLFFLVSRRWRMALWTAVGAVGSTVVGFVVFGSMSVEFFTHTIFELDSKVDLGSLFATSGNNSVQGAMAAVAPWGRSVGLVLAVIALGLGLWAATRVADRLGLAPAAVVVGLTAAIVSPVSWIHHWVYLIPALVYLGFTGGRAVRWFAILAAVLLVGTRGPSHGDSLLATGGLLHDVAGVLMRESLLGLSIAVIVILVVMSRGRADLPDHVRRDAHPAGRVRS